MAVVRMLRLCNHAIKVKLLSINSYGFGESGSRLSFHLSECPQIYDSTVVHLFKCILYLGPRAALIRRWRQGDAKY